MVEDTFDAIVSGLKTNTHGDGYFPVLLTTQQYTRIHNAAATREFSERLRWTRSEATRIFTNNCVNTMTKTRWNEMKDNVNELTPTPDARRDG